MAPSSSLSPPALDREAGVSALTEQLPRLMRVLHALKTQNAAQGRDRAAMVLLYPLCRVGPLRQSELADLVHADQSTVSRHVTVLVERGLVQRVADESDGRASRLVLTDDGREQLDRLREERAAHLRRITADWTEDELAGFSALFERLLDGLAESLPTDPFPTPRTAAP